MIKLVIFDMDGVLVDARELHYQALNDVLPTRYKITREDHLAHYDGLPTKEKLVRLALEHPSFQDEATSRHRAG